MSKDLEKYVQTLLPKAKKNKQLSFERLNIMVMNVFKYFETEKAGKKGELAKIVESLDSWITFIQAHKGLNLNAMFES
jgi:hypothetical protein